MYIGGRSPSLYPQFGIERVIGIFEIAYIFCIKPALSELSVFIKPALSALSFFYQTGSVCFVIKPALSELLCVYQTGIVWLVFFHRPALSELSACRISVCCMYIQFLYLSNWHCLKYRYIFKNIKLAFFELSLSWHTGIAIFLLSNRHCLNSCVLYQAAIVWIIVCVSKPALSELLF